MHNTKPYNTIIKSQNRAQSSLEMFQEFEFAAIIGGVELDKELRTVLFRFPMVIDSTILFFAYSMNSYLYCCMLDMSFGIPIFSVI